MRIRYKLSLLRGLISGPGYFWLGAGTVSSILLSLIEIAIAMVLQLFAVHLGVLRQDQLQGMPLIFSSLTFTNCVFIFICLGIVKSFGLFFANQSSVIFNQLVNARMRTLTAFELLLGRENQFVSASEVHTRFGEIYPKGGNCLLQINGFLSAGVQCLILVTYMFHKASKETTISILGVLCVGLVIRVLNRRIIGASSEIINEQAKISESVERVTRNWLFVRIAGTQRVEFRRLFAGIRAYFTFSSDSSKYSTINSIVPSFFGTFLVGIILYASHEYIGTEGPILLAFFYLFMRFVQQLGVGVTCLSMAITYWPQFKRILQLAELSHADERNIAWEMQTSPNLLPEVPIATVSKNLSAPSIKIQNLTFRYSDRDKPVFENLNLQIEAGKLFAIVGPSGAGKSTLLLTILGLLKPQNGNVIFDDAPDSDYISKNRARISYVGVEPFLIEGTVRENLLYGAHDKISDNDLWAALQDAHVADVVKGLPGDLNYLLNENGIGLSAGQKQRIALARALVKKPNLLILDEATSNLDVDTESLVRETLQKLKGRCTIIAVSHRQGILASAETFCKLGKE